MRTMFLAIGLMCLVNYALSSSLPSLLNYGEVKFNRQSLRKQITADANKIVGGTAALVGEFPYQAALNLGGRSCGGTLISTSIVLTAAHCVDGLSPSSASTFKVTVNTTRLSGGTGAISRGVRKFVVHASYNPNTQDNDIALLALNSPITNVRFAKLPLADATTTYAGQQAVIVGWGTTSAGGTVSSNLLKATVTVLTNTECNLQYNNKITSGMVCAASPGKDTCQGDSGGPMLVDDVQIGITSFGKGCADPRFAGVYTRITRYVTWITTTSSTI
ncbi:trypsin alpha-3-like [Daphnia carinata]|uniref:trypsin alpha-3-like n=1 Tax=Daphnia carinata TaxID=120202 RepID=UPI00257E32B5|nr:trypsin alpha-3-like [Daphnia carinata]